MSLKLMGGLMAAGAGATAAAHALDPVERGRRRMARKAMKFLGRNRSTAESDMSRGVLAKVNRGLMKQRQQLQDEEARLRAGGVFSAEELNQRRDAALRAQGDVRAQAGAAAEQMNVAALQNKIAQAREDVANAPPSPLTQALGGAQLGMQAYSALKDAEKPAGIHMTPDQLRDLAGSWK